jgi:hypothetical protein
MKIEGMQGSFFIEYLCSCGLPVIRINEAFFACVHCDAICYAGNCFECKQLYEYDDEEEE